MTRCIVCGKPVAGYKGLKVATVWRTEIPVHYCGACRLYFLSRIPSRKELHRYYNEEYYIYNPVTGRLKNIFRKFRCHSQARYLRSLIQIDRFNILEVGSGEGLLLSLFRKNNSVFGLEYNDRVRAQAQKRFSIDSAPSEFEDYKKPCDLIIMSHSLEHFTDVNRIVRKAHALLKPGGCLFVEVPHSPLPGTEKLPVLNDYLNTAHIVNFTPVSLKKLLARHGFRVLDCSRYFYNLSTTSPERRKLAGYSLLTGTLPKPSVLADVLWYVLKSLFLPAGSYQKIPDGLPWQGLGDNIRVLVRKK